MGRAVPGLQCLEYHQGIQNRRGHCIKTQIRVCGGGQAPSDPLVCRECLTTSESDRCRKDSAQDAEPVVLPVSVARVLMKTSDQIQQDTSQVVPFALVLPWCDANTGHDWLFDTELLARTFIKALQEGIASQRVL